jgi:hypothetical protein
MYPRVNAYAVTPYYYAPEQNLHGATIFSIFQKGSFSQLDIDGTIKYLCRQPDISKTCFKGIQKLRPNHSLKLINGTLTEFEMKKKLSGNFDLHFKLIELLTSYSIKYERCALALSGGFDSTLLLSLIREAELSNFEIYTLKSNLPGYCEYETTKKTADYFGVELKEVTASISNFIEVLPSVVRSTEAPIYNLHLASKFILATAIKSDGVNCLITGDAADQVFSGTESNNYLPLVGSIMRDIGISYDSPFFNDDIISYGSTRQHKNKTALKKLNGIKMPRSILNQQKTPRLAPPFDISQHWNKKAVNCASEQLGIAPTLSSDASKTLWTSLGILTDHFFGDTICAV